MISLLALAFAFDPATELAADVLPPPEADWLDVDLPDIHGVADIDHLSIVRLHELGPEGLTRYDVIRATQAALKGRATSYDVVMTFQSAELPTEISSAAFHVPINNDEQWGTGVPIETHPLLNTHGVMWMNDPFYWDVWDVLDAPGEALGDWVFCHELGHRWLARARFDDGGDVSDAMLGRQRYHWSYFLNTPNSPMEGNAWVDHGDGSFTVDTALPWRFSSLDLYLMGMAERQEVEPTFLIEDVVVDAPVGPSSAPALESSRTPPTVYGRRRDITIDQIVDVLGPRHPEAALAPRDFSVLTLFLLAPDELAKQADLDKIKAHQASWEEAWFEATDQRSTVSFTFDDPTHRPPMPVEASLIPEVAR